MPTAAVRSAARALLAVLAVVAALLVAAPSPASAGPGFPPGDTATRTFTYEVRTRGTVLADLGVFRRVSALTMNDRRGWSLGGSIRFREVSSGGNFTLWLAEPSELPKFSPVCSAQYSCRVGRNVVINDARWRLGTSSWPDVAEYRHYVVNHELGHWLGRGHASCPAAGTRAPVMQQQSIGLQGCTSNTWPLLSERRAVAATWGVTVRAARPDVYAVKQHGTTGTEVHVLDGGSRFAEWQAHFSTVAGPTTPSAWDFAVADRDRDGVDDVIGIKRSGGASGKVEVHVLDGASGYRSWQLHAATAMPATRSALWAFDAADVDQDGHLDVVAVNRNGTDSRTTVHVLDGAARYARYLLHAGTVLPHTDTSWTFVTGDHDRDGVPDLYAIDRVGSSGNAEVHVLDGASRFTQRSARAVTPIPGDGASWTFTTDDFDADGWDEVIGVKRNGASGGTEVHVLADRTYSSFVSSARTPLPATDGEPGWRFVAD